MTTHRPCPEIVHPLPLAEDLCAACLHAQSRSKNKLLRSWRTAELAIATKNITLQQRMLNAAHELTNAVVAHPPSTPIGNSAIILDGILPALTDRAYGRNEHLRDR